MLRTTDHRPQSSAPVPAATTGSNLLLQLELQTRPPTSSGAARCLNHPHELALGGIPVTCSTCRARRDWLLINKGRHVYVRCRCGNQWPEPEITRVDFDAMLDNPHWTNYTTTDEGLTALGFDGSFAGTYLL